MRCDDALCQPFVGAYMAMRHSFGRYNEGGTSNGDGDEVSIADNHALDKIVISHRPKGGNE